MAEVLGLVNNSDSKLIDLFKEFAESSREIDIAVAYVKSSGLELVKDVIHGKKVRVIFSFEFLLTDPECIEKLMEFGAECKEYKTSGSDEIGFHPKLYIFKSEDLVRVVVGSSNLTAGGLVSNVESCLVIEGNYEDKIIIDIFNYFERIWHSSKANLVSKEDLKRYKLKKKEYERKCKIADDVINELKSEEGYTNSVIVCMSKEHDLNDIYNRLIGVPARSKSLFFKWIKKGTRVFIYYTYKNKGIGIFKIVKAVDEPLESEEVVDEWKDYFELKGEKYPNRVRTELIAKFSNPVTFDDLKRLNIIRLDTRVPITSAHLRHSVVPISDADGDAIENLLKEKNRNV
ncbi:hypothetical protein DRP04_12650 [Archaeoglobales archaeon]|nr:MAG: hypothetical protein DRP04_12650 [Archaeoglobales archaeon]RLI89491.1 MAG: hypothetical protein DRO98_00910 [Archaeoglobales archaeon]